MASGVCNPGTAAYIYDRLHVAVFSNRNNKRYPRRTHGRLHRPEVSHDVLARLIRTSNPSEVSYGAALRGGGCMCP